MGEIDTYSVVFAPKDSIRNFKFLFRVFNRIGVELVRTPLLGMRKLGVALTRCYIVDSKLTGLDGEVKLAACFTRQCGAGAGAGAAGDMFED